MCEVQIRAGVGCETGLFKPVKHSDPQPVVNPPDHGALSFLEMFLRPVQTNGGSLAKNCFLSFSEYLL